MSSCLKPSEFEALLADNLAPERKRPAELHLDGCARCRSELAARRADENLFTDLKSACVERTVIVGDDSDESLPRATPVSLPTFDGYDVLEEVHRGGQGIVYKALQRATRRTVALKVLLVGPYSTERQRGRFEREIDLVSVLRHPRIVTVFDGGLTSDGRHCFVMEYVEGRPLDKHLEQSESSLREKLILFCKICEAINHAHLRSVIHRDLKPGNILIDEQGEPRVLDFGLAKPIDPDADQLATVTIPGEFMGTLAYASPEQISGDPDQVDVRSDVYSLGVTLFEMLTGKRPYEIRGRMSEVLRTISRAAPLRPSSICGSIDDEVETVVLTALAKDKERRYQSVAALQTDVERYLSGLPIEAKRDSGWYVVRKTLRRHRVAVMSAALALTMLSGFGATMAVLYSRAQHAARRAGDVQSFLAELLASVAVGDVGPDARIRDLLGRAEARLERQLSGQPEVEARVRLVIARTYARLWDPENAALQFRAALEMNRRIYGRQSVEAAECLHGLGNALVANDPVEAVALHEEALAIRVQRVGSTSAPVAESRVDLAIALSRIAERANEADVQFASALRVYETLQPPNIAGEARCYHSLAMARSRARRAADADKYFLKALALYRELRDPHNHHLAECINDYSMYLMDVGRFDEAEAYTRDSLDLVPRAYGEQWRPYVIWRLGNVKHARGDFAGAERAYRRALAITSHGMGDKFPARSEELMRFAALFTQGMEDDDLDVPYVELFELLAELDKVRAVQLAQGLLDVARLKRDRGQCPRATSAALACLEFTRPQGEAGAAIGQAAREILAACAGENLTPKAARANLRDMVQSITQTGENWRESASGALGKLLFHYENGDERARAR